MNAHPRVPDVLLEQYRLRELPHREADRIAELIHQDPTLRERLDALDRSDEALRRDGAIDAIAGRVRNHIDRQGHGSQTVRRRSASYWIVPALAAVTIAIAVVARTLSPPPMDAGTERIKGLHPALALYRRTADGSETLADGAVARRGDLVRVGYRAAGRAYGVIFSVDGRGAVTMHLPPTGDRAVPLAHEPTVLLDQAYELDDAPQLERFYFVTGRTAFDVAPIVNAARRDPSPALALSRELEQSSFSLQKEANP